MITNKTERRIIAVAIGIISGCISFSFYSDGVTGAKLIIVAGLVIALKTGEFFFAMDIFNYWQNNQMYKAAGSAVLVAVFYCLSVAATSISWYMQPQKEVAKLDVQRDIIKTLQADVAQAKAALDNCPAMTFKNCITPKTAVLNEKQALLTAAIAESGKLSDVMATAKTWDGIAAFFDTDRATLEFGRDLIGGMLFDLIGILFFAQSGGHDTTEKKPVVLQSRIDTAQPDIIQTEPVAEYQAAPVVSEYIDNQSSDLIYSNCKDGLLESLSLTGDILVCAPEKGSGKSSIAAWFARICKKAGHRVVVVDINFKRGVEKTMGWYLDDDIEIIGGNGNYNQVADFFKGIEAECSKRHKLNHNNYQQITIVVDEMVSINERIDIEIVKTFLKTILTNGRQLKINLMICTHAPTIEGTGLKGLTGLKAGLECELFPSVDDETKRCCVLKVVTRLDLRTQKMVKKSTLYNHPGAIVANWIADKKQPNFQPVIDSIVNVPPKELKKNLNDDIFS